MKRISADYRKGYAKVVIENADDLWYLSQIIEKGDLVSGKTFRKIKQGGSEEKENSSKKPVFIQINVEKVEFSESQTLLRVLGTITESPEDIPHGEHHTFNLSEGTQIKIEKENWLSYQIDKLDEAFSAKAANILLAVFDREEAYIALMKKYGYEILARLKGNVAKKAITDAKVSNFYDEIIKQLEEYDLRYNPTTIVLGSPSFWKEELLKNMPEIPLRKKLLFASCSSVDTSAINELLRRDEVRKALSADRITREINLVEDLMGEISKDGKYAYGIKNVKAASEAGAVAHLLVTDSLINKLRSEGKFGELDYIMRTADKGQSKIHIISSRHEGGKKLAGLGGAGAILRYKMNY